ncbi:MAG: YfhO family protein [Patescibacteria group bacterium]|nr:YfhO family protein [Patescibacteria group bacterium]
MTPKIQKIFLPVIFFFLLLVFFAPYLNGSNILYEGDYTGSDLTELNLPFRYWAAEQIKHGDLPLWNDQISAGFPQLAEGQTGVFYPFNLIFFILLPIGFAVLATYFLNFLLAGIFTFIYCRSLNISQVGSWLAATAFSFSGWFVFRLKHLNLINAAIWLPLIFYLIEKLIVSKRKDLLLVLLSGVYTIQFFAGHPQISYISVLAGLAYYLIRLLGNDEFKKSGRWLKIYKIIFPWMVIGFLTLGMTAIQLLPTYQLSKLSARGSWSDFNNSVGTLVFQPVEFLTAIYPYIFGNPANGSYQGFDLGFKSGFWEDSVYFGLLPLFFSFIALIFVWRKEKIIRQLSFFLVFCLFFILAGSNPWFKWVWSVLPSYQVFRFHQRFLLPFILIMSVLSALGFDYCAKKIANVGKTGKAAPRNLNSGWSIIVILIVSIELLFMSLQFIGTMPTTYLTAEPESVEWLKADQDQFRVASLYYQLSWNFVFSNSNGWLSTPDLYLENRELVQPNLNLFYGLSTYNDRGWNEGGQLDRRLAALLTVIDKNITLDVTSHAVIISPNVLKVLGLQNVKYLLSYYPVRSNHLAEVKSINQLFLPTLHIYQNPYFLNRAFMVFQSKPVNADADEIASLFADDFDPSKVVTSAAELGLKPALKAQSQVEVISHQANKSAYRVKTDSDGLLFISQLYYPGWIAKVDGKKVDLERVNGAYTGLMIPSGEHRVELKYDPKSFELGLTISLLTLILIIIYFAMKLLVSMRSVFKL